MNSRAVAVVLLVVLVASSFGMAQEEGLVVGRPDLELSAQNSTVSWGQEATVDVYLSNSGDVDIGGPAEFEQRVTTARNVRLRVREETIDDALATELAVETGTVVAGTVPPGVVGPFGFTLEIGDGVPPGSYEIPVEIAYEYTNSVRYGDVSRPVYGDRTAIEVQTVPLVVEDRPRLELSTDAGQSVAVGSTATYNFTVRNTGTQPATDVGLTFETDNTSIFFGNQSVHRGSTAVYVDSLAPGEARTVGLTVSADARTTPGVYLVGVEGAYADPRGITRTADRLVAGVNVTAA